MTNNEEIELNERLLRKLGFTDVVLADVRLWSHPQEKCYCWRDENLRLTDNIANCFKWIIPELRKHGCEVVSFYYAKNGINCDLAPDRNGLTIESSANTEAMALCLAADKFLI